MTPTEYETFFELLVKVTNVGKTWKDKRDELLDAAEEYGSDAVTALGELSAWFPDGEIPDGADEHDAFRVSDSNSERERFGSDY